MCHSILKSCVDDIDLAHLAGCEVVKHLIADLHGIGIDRLLDRVGVILPHLIAKSCKCVPSLASYRINDQIILIPLIVPHKLDDIGIVAAGKPPAARDHDHSLFGGVVCLEVRMVDIPRFGEHGNHRLIHAVEIRLGLLCTSLRSLQFDGGNKLHGLRNLLCALHRTLTSLYVSH